jgi:tetratricopeptide (TPR) repeat protein
MKKQTFKSFAFIGLAAVTAVGCNPLSNMTKRANEVTYSVTPNPLEMHGDSIEVNISGAIPPRFFNKKVSAEITPVLMYNGSETSLNKLVLVGEESEVEGQKIPYEKGGNFSYNDKIAYQDGMDVATLEARAVGKYKGKEKAFGPEEIATGTIITPMWAMDDDMPILGADKFTKVTPMNQAAVINYVVNQSNVRSSELSDEDMKALKAWVAEMSKNPMFVFKGTDVVAYASPEGEISLNSNLADDRAASGASATGRILSSNRVKAASNKEFFNKMGKGEDWNGFKSAMQASDIKDKDLILRVLEMYEDNTKREEEIRNLAATFEVIQEEILPDLRRSEITVKGEMTSFSDEKIKEYSKSNPDTLSKEELLYAATLTTDMDEKMNVYTTYSKLHPKDWRGPNNVAYIYIMKNDMEKAKAELDKANSISPNNPVINNNLGVYERANGNDDKAMEYYEAASGAGPEVGNNIGYLQMVEGDYTSAVSNYGSVKSFNAALAQTLNKDNQAALKTIDASPAADQAAGYYLKAVIGARMGDQNMVITNLKSAIAKDSALKAKAQRDAEFTKYKDNSEFQAVIN